MSLLRHLRHHLGAIAALAVGGCMVGPNFVKPEPPRDRGYLPDALVQQTVASDVLGGEAQRFVHDLDIPGQWWQAFESRPLNALIERSLLANPDIHAAMASLRVAQQNAKAQRAALFPTVSIGGSATQSQAPTSLSAPTADGGYIFGLFTALVSISYAVDVFGGVRRQTESAEAVAEAQCFLLEAAYLTLASNVVVAAITEASLRAQLGATRRSIDIQRETLTLLQRQQSFGQIALADVAAQRAALAQSEASLPPLEKQLAQQRHLLSTLLGETTSHDPAATFDLASLHLPQDLPVSLPARLVEQRPDIRAAEANLHSASALIGVAVANQLPQINLSASFGVQSIALGMLFSPDVGPAVTTVGGSFLQTMLDGGALIARRRAAEAAFDLAKAQYRSTVLGAFRNVADTLSALELDAIALRSATDAERAAETSLTIARHRLGAGDIGSVQVLNAELVYQQALLARVQAQAGRYADAVALYQALGGGWWNRGAVDNPARRAICKPPGSASSARQTARSG
jgi:NodT family efflux transporter outer membrane factor (OMF) lipoprotein